MKNTPAQQAAVNTALAELACELSNNADHYRGLAKDLALELLQNPDAHDAGKKKFTAQHHLIRAEIYRTSANIAVNRQVTSK